MATELFKQLDLFRTNSKKDFRQLNMTIQEQKSVISGLESNLRLYSQCVSVPLDFLDPNLLLVPGIISMNLSYSEVAFANRRFGAT